MSTVFRTAATANVEAPSLYFKVDQIGGEWVTRQLGYLSKAEVAALLHVSERTVYDYVNRTENPLPCFKLPGGRALLFKLDEVERWLESSEEPGV